MRSLFPGMAVWVVLVGFLSLGMNVEPASAQISDSAAVPWKLDFKVDRFSSVVYRDKTGKAETLWYLAFTVTNNGDSEAPLSLHFRADTDTKKKYFERTHKGAEKLIESRMKTDLLSSSERPKTLPAGESLKGIAILGQLDPQLDRITIKVSGLEDVVYRVGTKRFYRNRGLLLEWRRPGDEFQTHRDVLKFTKRAWEKVEPREVR